MATNVSGPLKLVTDQPASFVQGLVRAPRSRPYAGGMVVDFTTPATVTDGVVEFPCVPGPAVLSVMHAGVPQITVPLVVPDKAEASLEECMRAAKLADTATRSELEDLARRVVEGVSQAEQAAGTATEQAEIATEQADVASGAAATATEQAQVAAGHADAAAGSAGAAAASEQAAKTSEQAAKQAESGARDSEQTASEQAGVATQGAQTATGQAEIAAEQADRATSEADRATSEADRAGQAAEASSAKAVTERVDRLLAGAPEAYDTLLEIAEELERGRTVEAALVKEIAGKAPAEHTHTIEDVTGLQSALDGKANTGSVPVTEDGYNTHDASDPATDYPIGVSYSMHNGTNYGWNAAIKADTGYDYSSSFVLVQTLRKRTYTKSTTQLVFSYKDTHMPVFMRKWYGEDWGPFRSLTDDGHTHTVADVTGLQSALDGKVDTSDVSANPTNGSIPRRTASGAINAASPTSPAEVATKSYVDNLITGREVLLQTDRTITTNGEWETPNQNLLTPQPDWVTLVEGSAIYLGGGVFEIVAQAQGAAGSAASTGAGGMVIYARNGGDWIARSGTDNADLNGASMIFDTRPLPQPRIYVGCYPTAMGLRINMLIRKLL